MLPLANVLVRSLFLGSLLSAGCVFAQETQVIVDHFDRSVEVPVAPERVLTNFMPFPHAWFIATGSTDGLVGMAGTSRAMAERSMFSRIAPEVLDISTAFADGTAVNIEEILKLAPDVIVTYENHPQLGEMERTGIPTLALAISSASLFKGNVIDTFEGWLRIISQLAGTEERAESIIANARDVEAAVGTALAGVEHRPTALHFQYLDAQQLSVNATGSFGDYWLGVAGGENLATEGIGLKTGFGIAELDMETIYSLNPEVIFITNFTATKPEDLYENRLPGQDWSHVTAVQNRRVYKVPEGIFQWTPPSADAPLMLQWLASKLHPDAFPGLDFDQSMRDHYSRFYGYELSDEEVALILNPQF